MTTSLIAFLLLAQVALLDKEALQLAGQIESCIAEEDGSWVDKTFDVDTLLLRILKDTPSLDPMRAQIQKTLKAEFPLGRTLSKAVKNAESGQFVFRGLRDRKGQTRALFRQVTHGVNYQEFLLEKDAAGAVRMVDVYTFATGEFYSETLRRLFQGMVADSPASGPNAAYVRNLGKLSRMVALRGQGKPAEALKLFDTLPDNFKKEHSFQLQRVGAAAETGAKEGVEAMEAFKKLFPGDPALSILSIDIFVAQKKFDQAQAGIDELDRAVGGDSYLEFLKGSFYLMAGEPDKAKASARKAIAQDKTEASPYWLLVTVSLNEKKYGETVQALLMIEKTLELKLGDLTDAPIYADFVNSPEYAAWMKRRK